MTAQLKAYDPETHVVAYALHAAVAFVASIAVSLLAVGLWCTTSDPSSAKKTHVRRLRGLASRRRKPEHTQAGDGTEPPSVPPSPPESPSGPSSLYERLEGMVVIGATEEEAEEEVDTEEVATEASATEELVEDAVAADGVGEGYCDEIWVDRLPPVEDDSSDEEANGTPIISPPPSDEPPPLSPPASPPEGAGSGELTSRILRDVRQLGVSSPELRFGDLIGDFFQVTSDCSSLPYAAGSIHTPALPLTLAGLD